MNKTKGTQWLALALILCLACAAGITPAGAEGQTPAVCGNWYAALNGFSMQLTLMENGVYLFSFPGLPDEPVQGTWEENDGFIILDGNEASPLSWDGDSLSRAPLGLFFSREEVRAYTPGELMSETTPALYAGAWRAAYVVLSGAALPARLMGEDIRLYIEDSTVALTGGIFPDAIVEFAYENAALSLSAEDASITLHLQEDSLLRLTVAGDGEAYTLILERFSLTPDTEE